MKKSDRQAHPELGCRVDYRTEHGPLPAGGSTALGPAFWRRGANPVVVVVGNSATDYQWM